MATVAEKSADLAVPEWSPSQAVDEKIDRYLASRLKAVGADYRSVAITTFLLASAIGLTLWLAAGVIADHWLVPGGLGRTLRMGWLAIGGAGLLAAAIRWVVPLVRYRVNLVYAARSIERANPELRNDVVNTVLVRARPERISPMVVTSLEHRTAKRLSKLPVDVVTDRGPALRLAVALAILVGLACLYAVLSPKSMATSLARLVAPWSRVPPPTRVRIAEPEFGWRLPAGERGGDEAFHAMPVKDGRATIIRNRQLVVRSRIQGMAAGDEPSVESVGIADDGSIDRTAGWRTRMESAAASGGFEAMLPGGGHGLSNDIVVTVTAGDARSEPVRVVVVDAPSLLVKQLKLVPPAYTHREPEVLEWQGDVSGLEGTKVTLLAESKDPLETAAIDFGCDGQGLVKLRIDPRDLARASGSFDLRLASDRSGPWERDYQLVFRPQGGPGGDGRERGIEHRIHVIADMMPEVRVVEPNKPVVKVPPEKPVAVGVEAVDPDFALRSVAIELELERNGERMSRPAQPILDREFAGTFRGQAVFKPASVGGQAGDRLRYRAVAVDSKTPSPNSARSEWFTLELDAGAPPRAVPQSGQQADGQQEGAGADGSKNGNSENGNSKDVNSKNGTENGTNNSSNAGSSGGGQEKAGGGQPQQGTQQAAQEGKTKDGDTQEGNGEQGSGPPQKGSQGERSQGKGGSADGSSEPSQQAEGSGKEDDSSSGGNSGQSDSRKSNSGQSDSGQSDSGKGDNAGSQGGAEGRREEGAGGSNEGESGERQPADGHQQQQGGQQQNGRGSGDPAGSKREGAESTKQSEKPVASDGTNDGEAIERILQDKAAKGNAAKGNGARGNNPEGDKPQSSDPQSGAKDGGAKDGDAERGSEKQSGEKPAGDKPANENRQNENSDESAECRPQDGKPCGDKECSTCRGGDGQAGGQQDSEQKGSGQNGSDQKGSGEQGESKQDQGRKPGGSGQDGGASSGGQASGKNDSMQKDGSKKPGSGEAGGGQPADDGGETASQPGGDRGESKSEPNKTGKTPGKPSGDSEAAGKPGDRAGAQQDDSAENSKGGKPGEGKSGGGKPGDSDEGRAGEDLANDDPASDRKPSEQAGAGGRAGRGLGGSDAGEEGKRSEGQAADKEAEWGEENISHARNAVDLAVEHLKRSMDEGRSDVLDSLGWSREQAQAFLDRWARMAKSAKEGGPRKQQDFDRAVRSLGLTPSGVRRSRTTGDPSRGNQAEGRRSQPPPEYREQFRAFTQGLRGDGG